MKIDVHLHPEEFATALREDVIRGLSSTPKELPPKWFYDERGSLLFDEITRLDEYYPTRREREILQAHAGEIAELTGATSLIELGSGTSEKTHILLNALQDAGTLERFVPFDVSEEVLCAAAASIETSFGIAVHAVVGDFERHLDRIPVDGRCVVAFLGGTIGNFAPAEREHFLKELGATVGDDDHVLIGFDLVKDPGRLEAAYDDARGVTAQFNKNVLHVINRELDADFDVDAFDHVAAFDVEDEWIEMRLRSTVDQVVQVRGVSLEASFVAGEEMRTEISAKFTPDRIEQNLSDAGLSLVRLWTDAAGDFALALAR